MHDDRFTLANFRNSSLFFPFIFGIAFLVLILILAIVIRDPSRFQYEVFRIVLALAGAGFATSLTGTLEVRILVFQKGWVKATAGFAVFVLLLFFSPGSLVVHEAKLRAEAYKQEYDDSKSDVFQANVALVTTLHGPESAPLLRTIAKEPNAETLGAYKSYVNGLLADHDNERNFEIVERFYKEVITCAENGKCDATLTCEFFFEDIEEFRWTFCDRLIEIGETFADRTWDRYDEFTIDRCLFQFVKHYINFRTRNFEGICFPTQCWARNLEPPYPCQVRKQVDQGILTPSAFN